MKGAPRRVPEWPPHTGVLTRRAGQPVQTPFVCRLLEPDALAAVRDIHQEALRLLPEPGLVRADSDAFFAAHFAGEGRIFGVFAEERLTAYAILGLPASRAYPYDRFADDLNLPADEEFRVAQLIGVGVRPEWRGNGLHRRLCTWRLELARAADCWYAAAVSAPGNVFSWRNLLAVGLRIRRLKLLGGDKLRYLLHSDLRGSPPPDPATCVAVAALAISEQEALLAQGYWGYAALVEAGIPQIQYARPCRS